MKRIEKGNEKKECEKQNESERVNEYKWEQSGKWLIQERNIKK